MTHRTKGILLSSDKGLRNITKRNNLDVRGVLWIIEALVDHTLISKENAVQKLREYPSINVRAPRKEINKLIEDLNSSL
jgi:predicted nucleic acid-binding protein